MPESCPARRPRPDDVEACQAAGGGRPRCADPPLRRSRASSVRTCKGRLTQFGRLRPELPFELAAPWRRCPGHQEDGRAGLVTSGSGADGTFWTMVPVSRRRLGSRVSLLGVTAQDVVLRCPPGRPPPRMSCWSPCCLNACTYCKTKHARGSLASYSVVELVERARQSFQGHDIKLRYQNPTIITVIMFNSIVVTHCNRFPVTCVENSRAPIRARRTSLRGAPYSSGPDRDDLYGNRTRNHESAA
ncbi:hypothetical protein P4O66_001284 [Electrophorus voltai]|uniref:Uncharacterized protein n=1 Tax=Electrophorus voltai TaxID=2609070 RepID=A0AAD8ZAB5_9TELE|nr:hypothetical protein P4O66_001284 [Electrophorus voltai]